MGWFSKKRGIDITMLIKTKYWNGVESMIQTDQETYQRLVQYIYEQVSESIVAELERTVEHNSAADAATIHEYLHKRIQLLNKYKELAHDKDENNGSK